MIVPETWPASEFQLTWSPCGKSVARLSPDRLKHLLGATLTQLEAAVAVLELLARAARAGGVALHAHQQLGIDGP